MSFGRLERTKGSPPMSEINMTPLIDVMLVLVVIFIITAPLMTSAIKLDLPKTEAAKPVDAPKFVAIIVDKSGQIFLNDQATSLTQLSESLSKTALRQSRRSHGCGAKSRLESHRLCGRGENGSKIGRKSI
jgi:biopolymer transport protein TolR